MMTHDIGLLVREGLITVTLDEIHGVCKEFRPKSFAHWGITPARDNISMQIISMKIKWDYLWKIIQQKSQLAS